MKQLLLELFLVFLALNLIFLYGCFPKELGERLINKKCTACHTTSRIYKKNRPDEEWDEIIERMIRHGATLSAQEKKTIINYLKNKY